MTNSVSIPQDIHQIGTHTLRISTAAKAYRMPNVSIESAWLQIMALHNHLLVAAPNVYLMHFWAHDTPDRECL